MKIKAYFFVEMMLSIIFFLIFGSWLKAHVKVQPQLPLCLTGRHTPLIFNEI